MQREISIGKQDFAVMRESQCFYIYKTDFIKRWWDSRDDVTLLTRLRKEYQKDRSAIILEFKMHNSRRETSLEDTVQAALRQIKEKNYDAELLTRGVDRKDIRHYGFAFEGKKVLIG